ncbi:DELTA-actitoxin-Afr1a-like [Labrus mixtus]|uniref:DELTA-actitoxin-Afr1a-like n=1 Tax=Labrus mixtus TaxID=508554 RepID=UPI0029BFF585|nr:DELTA-actitoxin-Afr1a-like [Labrus mixtus]
MSESAEALAANLNSRRNVTIEISNITNNYCLIDPKIYMDSGHCHVPPQPTIIPMKTELCNFTKTSAKASGAVGLLTYDLLQKSSNRVTERLVVMFSVPYDNGMYKNWFGLGIYSTDRDVDEKLYKEMYYNKEQVYFLRAEASGCGLIFNGRDLDFMATMSPLGRSIMKVEIWDKLFNPPMSQGPY